jgi:hypothetical protein
MAAFSLVEIAPEALGAGIEAGRGLDFSEYSDKVLLSLSFGTGALDDEGRALDFFELARLETQVDNFQRRLFVSLYCRSSSSVFVKLASFSHESSVGP